MTNSTAAKSNDSDERGPSLPIIETRSDPLDRLRSIIAERCVLTSSSDGWLVAPTGETYGWLIDMRQAFLDAEALDIITDLFWDRFASALPFQFGGLEIAAIPLVIALILKARQRGLTVNGFVLRKERKPSGVGKVLEGRIGPEPIFAVDDILNSGTSLEKVRTSLADLGRTIDRVFVIVDYLSTRGRAWLDKNDLRAESLFTLKDFGLADERTPMPKLNAFKTVWTFRSPRPNHFHINPKSSPVVADGKVIFGSDRGTLWALDVVTGDPVWTFQISSPYRKGIWSRAAVHDDRVYFGAYDGNLYCLDLATGAEIWRFGGADWIGSSPALSPADGLLWVGLEHERPGQKGSVVALDMISGVKVWEQWMPHYVHGSPIFSRSFGAVAVGCNDRRLYLLDAISGAQRWSFETRGAIKEAPLFDEARGLVYCAGFDGMIRAIDVRIGRQVWAIMTPDLLYSKPLLVGAKLFVGGTDKNLHVIDLDEHSHTKIDLGSKCLASPTLIDGRVFIGANNGVVHEIDAEFCAIVGKHQLPDGVTGHLAHHAALGGIFALTYMNQLIAFRREASS